MQCDNLIKKLLKAAAVTEAVFFGLTAFAMGASGILIRLFYSPYLGSSSSGLISFSTLLPTFFKTVFLTAVFYVVWYFLNQAADPGGYKTFLPFLLIGLRVLVIPANLSVSYFQTMAVTQKGVELMGSYSIFNAYFLNPLGWISLAAELILFIVLGMEWYRDSLLKEQAVIAARAAAEAAFQQQNGTAPSPEVPDDSGWAAYRSTLIKEQADAQPLDEFVFNNKP